MSSPGRQVRRGATRTRRPSRQVIHRRRRAALGGGLLLVVAVVLLIEALTGGGITPPPAPGFAGAGAAGSPLVYGYIASSSGEYARRAAAGEAQVLFTLSPGGVFATAARVARFRGEIQAAVRGSDIPADLLEGLVFLESAGRPQVIAGSSVADAAGLTQILAGTGSTLLGMRIDLAASRRLTHQIALALGAGQTGRAARLERRRAAVDPRFDPVRELAATVRYLKIAERDLGGRVDLAIAAYHAGIGNMQQVLSDFGSGEAISYARLYFGSSPAVHAAAYALLSGLGDDSSLYYWRVLEAERIMALYRTDRAELHRLDGLETGYPSDALVLVPPGSGRSFADPQALAGAYQSRAVVPLPRDPAALHLAYSSEIGSLARSVQAPAALYRGLRPSALRTLLSIAAEVHALAPRGTPLIVTAAVADRRYEAKLGALDPPASTGDTFSIERRYGSGTEAAAFQFVLDRLQALDLIGWLRTPTAIEITAAPDAGGVIARGI